MERVYLILLKVGLGLVGSLIIILSCLAIYRHALFLTLLTYSAWIAGIIIVIVVLFWFIPRLRAYLHAGYMMKAELALQERQAEKLQGETQKLDAERELHLASAERARREAENSMISAHATVYQARAQDKTAEGQRIRAEAEHIRAEAEAERIRAEAERIRAEAEKVKIEGMISLEEGKTRILLQRQQSHLVRVASSESLLYLEEGNFKQIIGAQTRQSTGRVVNQPGIQPGMNLLPSAPTFSGVVGLIEGEEHIPMAYANDRIVWGSIEKHLLSQLVLGMPGQGKSTALLYYLAVLLKVQCLPIVMDPQGTLTELDGLFPYYGDMSSMIGSLPTIRGEIKHREQWYREDREQFKREAVPMLVLIDEIPLIAASEDDYLGKGEKGVLDLIRHIVLENRKHKVFCIAAGQSVPATVLETITRDNMSSRLVFLSKERQALTAGLDEKSRKILMPLIEQAGPGTAILDMSAAKEPMVVSIPLTLVEDIIELINEDGERYLEWRMKLQKNTLPDTGALSRKMVVESQSDFDRAFALYQQGISGPRALQRELGINYYQAGLLCQQIEAALQQQ